MYVQLSKQLFPIRRAPHTPKSCMLDIICICTAGRFCAASARRELRGWGLYYRCFGMDQSKKLQTRSLTFLTEPGNVQEGRQDDNTMLRSK